ncbi:probable amidase At4g34880 [Papaver somniferum]|uniref:probable amidase At4g34880 n=1 Tax=Papaver somniferum TaxID=3469 RepID=UPI000E701933|nr:probable amidase At4g34880 [Papaver somniferum]
MVPIMHDQEMTDVYDQNTMIDAEKTSGNEAERQGALLNMQKLDNEGFKSKMIKNNSDAVVIPGNSFSTVLAIGEHPGIIVPAGYEDDGMPVGICFGGLRGSEPKLIEIAYGFKQIKLIRKPPPSTTFISDV